MQRPQTTRNLVAWLAAFFVVVLGAKLWTIQLWATNIPYWDQWDEARQLFKPWLEGTLTWHDFIIPHNEHRILFTRLLDLLEVKVNGQWDPVFQTVVNAVIHIGFGCMLVVAIWSAIRQKFAGLICCALLPFFALPFAGENTTHGFQSQMYFVNIFSVAAILGLGFGRAGGGIWFAGLAAAALSIFTMASGFLAAMAVIGLVVLRALKQRRLTPGQIVTIVCGVAVIALGLWLKVDVARHEVLKAHSFGDFFTALLTNLSWPFSGMPVMAVVPVLPLAILFVKYLQPNYRNQRGAEFVLTFGLWVILQLLALAFGRALFSDVSRYFDALSLLPIAGFAALFVLAADFDFRHLSKKFGLALAVLWSVVVLGGLFQCSQSQVNNYLNWARSWGLLQTENVHAFIATGEAGWLHSKSELAVPYWNQDWLIDLLRDPKILSIMPADARHPLRLEANATLSTGFNTNGWPPGSPSRPFMTAWGNTATNGKVVAGHFVSQPMTSTLPKLSIQVYRSGAEKIELASTGGRLMELTPSTSGHWETLIVETPPSPFTLLVENASAEAPVAIGEIKELGRCSVYAQVVVSHAVLILSIGLCFCLLLSVVAITRPGISLTNEGVPWLCLLLLFLTLLAGAYAWRNYDGNEYAFERQTEWASRFAGIGHPGRALLHLREAAWLQPDNVEVKKELGVLEARGGDEQLPEKQLPEKAQ